MLRHVLKLVRRHLLRRDVGQPGVDVVAKAGGIQGHLTRMVHFDLRWQRMCCLQIGQDPMVFPSAIVEPDHRHGEAFNLPFDPALRRCRRTVWAKLLEALTHHLRHSVLLLVDARIAAQSSQAVEGVLGHLHAFII